MSQSDLDRIIEEAKALEKRASGASLYPAHELVVVAQMIKQLATLISQIPLHANTNVLDPEAWKSLANLLYRPVHDDHRPP